jgi:glycosyltransferase involved in cell wall biosynthesis
VNLRCLAVIPCLNEAATIGSVVHGVRVLVPDVLVIDDGSSDATADVARSAGAQVLVHAVTRGKGASLNDGLNQARAQEYEWALLLDGDGQHAPHDIPAFLRAAQEAQGAVDLIVGNRMASAESMPRMRRWVNRWMSRRLSHLVGQELPDSQCGFRMLRLDAWTALQTEHFEVESEMLVSFARTGRKIVFVPIEVIYKSEQSKIHPLRDTVRWFRWLRSQRGR